MGFFERPGVRLARIVVPSDVPDFEMVSQPSHTLRRDVLKWFLAIGVGILASVLFRVYVAEAFEVPTGSMLNTIQLNDRIIGEKVSYLFRDPQRGDIVTFPSKTEPGMILVKRIIGLPGETLTLHEGQVYVDGHLLDEPYVTGPTFPAYGEGLDGAYVLGPDEYWVMGDNRTNSSDSRFFGPISREDILTHVCLVFWPFSEFGPI